MLASSVRRDGKRHMQLKCCSRQDLTRSTLRASIIMLCVGVSFAAPGSGRLLL